MTRVSLAEFNELPADDATAVLAPLCSCAAWQRVLVTSRPFVTAGELAATSDGVLRALGWSDVQDALAADPDLVPLTERPAGDDGTDDRTDDETEQRAVRQELAAAVRTRLAETLG